MNRTMLRALLGALLLIAACAQAQADDAYERVMPPQPTQTRNKIEVAEIFWYGCPHCYAFEPYVEKWLKTKPDDVNFVRIPGVLGQNWVADARAFYAAEKLGVLDKIHRPLFDAIHKDHKMLFTEDSLRDFFESQGVDGDAFTKAYNSNEVDVRVKEALDMERRYQITGVPTVIVDGRWRTSASQAGSFEGLIKVIDKLVDKARAERNRP